MLGEKSGGSEASWASNLNWRLRTGFLFWMNLHDSVSLSAFLGSRHGGSLQVHRCIRCSRLQTTTVRSIGLAMA